MVTKYTYIRYEIYQALELRDIIQQIFSLSKLMNIFSLILINILQYLGNVWVSSELDKLILKCEGQWLDQVPLTRVKYKVRGFYNKMYYKVQISKTV